MSDSDHSTSPTPTQSMMDGVPLNPSPVPEMDLLNLDNSCEQLTQTKAPSAAPLNLLDMDGEMSSSPSNFDLLINTQAPLIGLHILTFFGLDRFYI